MTKFRNTNITPATMISPSNGGGVSRIPVTKIKVAGFVINLNLIGGDSHA